MASSNEDISLSELYRRGLRAAARSIDLPTVADETQEIVSGALLDLRGVANRVNTLGLFSPNESFDELSTRNAAYMLVPYAIGDLELRKRSSDDEQRMDILRRATITLTSFIRLIDDYEIVSEADKKLHTSPPPTDPTKFREDKIARYKAEKSIKTAVEALQQGRKAASASHTSTDYDLILGLVPESQESDDGDEEEVRKLVKTVLKMFWVQAVGHLGNVAKEIKMIREAPPRPQGGSEPGSSAQGGDTSWRLDMPLGGQPLLDKSGRPLRPFTILPSEAGERARLRAEVFRADHRLPTMTIDEYLEEERRRGNIISGGGEASFNAPTSKEILKEASEMDGTLGGDEKSEQKRREEEEWALFTESNPKGMGNTMNRG